MTRSLWCSARKGLSGPVPRAARRPSLQPDHHRIHLARWVVVIRGSQQQEEDHEKARMSGRLQMLLLSADLGKGPRNHHSWMCWEHSGPAAAASFAFCHCKAHSYEFFDMKEKKKKKKKNRTKKKRKRKQTSASRPSAGMLVECTAARRTQSWAAGVRVLPSSELSSCWARQAGDSGWAVIRREKEMNDTQVHGHLGLTDRRESQPWPVCMSRLEAKEKKRMCVCVCVCVCACVCV